MQKTYYFRPADYDGIGQHKSKPDYLFTDFIRECEADFHEAFKPYFANTLHANSGTYQLLQNCFDTERHPQFGMESIDGEVDVDMNLQIEAHSLHRTVYALGSELEDNKDEPIFLAVADKYRDGRFALTYSTDDEDEEAAPDETPLDYKEVNRNTSPVSTYVL